VPLEALENVACAATC